jgi:hypothetical protein
MLALLLPATDTAFELQDAHVALEVAAVAVE